MELPLRFVQLEIEPSHFFCLGRQSTRIYHATKQQLKFYLIMGDNQLLRTLMILVEEKLLEAEKRGFYREREQGFKPTLRHNTRTQE